MRAHNFWSERFLLPFLLAVACAWIYGPAVDHAYVSFGEGPPPLDDPSLRAPLDARWIADAILHPHHGAWAPVPRFALRVEAMLQGFDRATTVVVPGALLLVIAGALFAAVLRRTGAALATSALAAGALVLHPLMADLVCRADTRGDLLALVFLLAALCIHGGGARTTVTREAGIFACTLLAVMSSPLGIFTPFALVWTEAMAASDAEPVRPWLRALVPKIPLFALALLALALTSRAARGGAAALYSGALDPAALVAARVHGWATALTDLVWPFGITTLRSHAMGVPAGKTIAVAIVLVCAAWVATRHARSSVPRRALTVALVGSLPLFFVPGPWAPPARWSVVPLLALAWAIGHTITALRPRWLAASIALSSIAVLGGLSGSQVNTWRDARTALLHAVRVDPDSWLAHDRLAQLAHEYGDLDTALSHGLITLELAPSFGAPAIEIAGVIAERGDLSRAELLARHAARTEWTDRDAPLRLGLTLARVGLDAPAGALLGRVIARDPASSSAHAGLALVLARAGEGASAARHLALVDDTRLTEEARAVVVWLLATAPERDLGDPARALALAEFASPTGGTPDIDVLEAIAIAQARLGDWSDAFASERRAAAAAAARGWTEREEAARTRALGLLQRRAWTEPRADERGGQR